MPGTPTALVNLKKGEDEAIQALDGTEWQGSILCLEADQGKDLSINTKMLAGFASLEQKNP